MSTSIGLSLSATKLEVAPGQSIEATITVENRGQLVDQFGIRIQGLDPAWWTLSPASISLFPGDQGEVKLTVHPPKAAEARAGSYSFQVRAVSQANPEEMTVEEAYLMLGSFLGWDVDMSPRKATGRRGTYKLTASNSGNTDITLSFGGKDPEEALDYSFTHSKVNVPAGESVPMTLNVHPKKGRKGQLYNFQVLVRPAEAKSSRESRAIPGQLEYQGRRSPWKPILVVLALVAAAVVIWTILPAPVISFSADPQRIGAGSSSTLRWHVSHANEVVIDNGIGRVSLRDTRTVTPTETVYYRLTAKNAIGKSNTRSCYIEVIQLPVIHSFTANPTTIYLGGESTLSWSVSGADEVAIDHAVGSVHSSGTRKVSPTRTATYTLTASNEGGSRTASVQVAMPVVYDFVAQASHSRTVWRSGAGTSPGFEVLLAFPGAGGDNRGFARYLTNAVLEDNRTYDRVLQTHPQWVDDGYIRGIYLGLSDLGYKAEVGDRFYAKVGLLKNATAGNVKFRVVVAAGDGPLKLLKTLAEITDTYDGTLRTIDVDLSSYAGSSVDFTLQVLANGSSAQDWAVWVEARIVSGATP